jgi:hypothetical protein
MTGYDVVSSQHDIQVSKVRILMPYTVDDKTVFSIFYGERNPLLVQTPLCTVPYKFALYDDNYFHIDLQYNGSELNSLLDRIQTTILSKIRKRFHHILEGLPLVSPITSIKEDVNKIRLRNYNVAAIVVFDTNRKRIDIRNIEKNDAIRAIFQVDKLIVDAKSIQLGLKLVQLRKNQTALDPFNYQEYLFADEEAKDSKYRKMLKMGVPLLAVKQKMLLEGFSEQEVSLFEHENNATRMKPNTQAPPPPPPPPPPPCLSTKNNPLQTQPLAFLADIKNGRFSLKQTIVEPKTIDPKEKVLRFVDKTKKVPSLDEILQAKARLKKGGQSK